MKEIRITMYYWGGSRLGISINSECEECDINSSILRSMQENEFKGQPVSVSIQPWLSNIWSSLRYGGWHAPVVLVDDSVFSQGVVIDREMLAADVVDKLANNS